MAYSKRGRKEQRGTYGRGGFVAIADVLRQSSAYRVLTPSQKLVLFDWLRLYMRLSAFDKEPVPDGFSFSYANTIEPIDETTFYHARQRLVDVGFFEQRNDLKRLTPGAPDVFLPSTRWMHYKATDQEAERLDAVEQRKRRSLERGRSRKRRFMDQHPQRRKDKTK